MAKVTYDSVVRTLKQSPTNISCNDLLKYLEELGYEVTKGANGKHYKYDHPRLDWPGSNFDCGHGRNPQVLPIYIRKIIKVLESHKDELD